MTNPRLSYFVLLETMSGDYIAPSGCFKMKEKNFIPVTNQVAESISVHMVKNNSLTTKQLQCKLLGP